MKTRLPDTHKIIVTILFVFTAFIFYGCGDDNPTNSTVVKADVNVYMSSLPSWDIFCPPELNSDSTTGNTVENLDIGQGMFCRTTPCSITQTPDKIVTYGTFSNILWLGALIQGDSYAGGLGSLEELPIRQRAPLTIGVNFLSGDSISAVVTDPTATSVGQAIGTLISNAVDSGYQAGSSILFTQKEMHSIQQGMLSLGLSFKFMGTSIRNKLDLSATQKKHTVTAYFKQFMFETYMELPQTPENLFSSEFTDAKMEEQINIGSIGPDNLPVFVSRIQWGRIMVLTMSSDSSVIDMKNALKATHGSFSVDMTAKYSSILANSELEVVTFGGDDASALSMIRSGNIEDYFTSSPNLSTAFPIAYALNNLADNSLAKVSETTTYDLVECQQMETQIFTDWNEWKQNFSAIPDSVEDYFFTTNAVNVALANEVGSPPANNFNVGSILTFDALNTTYNFNFYLQSLDYGCPYPLVFNDTEFGERGMISIGDVGNCENDDFEIGVSTNDDDTYVFAIGFYLGHNGLTNEETLEVFYGNSKVKEFTYLDLPASSSGEVFMGIISTVPITKIVFNEDIGGDDIYIKDFCFGVAYR
ncbi:thiol-activated cytolysin family protein [Candidatus Babeliales bacterium]|nr:thiol-activated cytolysin family protein [Candidatus Babeliales bacterium]